MWPYGGGMGEGKPSARQRPTMEDVAQAAGVSLKTVSRVVNESPYVSAEKAGKVREAIARLGFRRNEYARGLRQGGTSTIGLVMEDTADPFYSALSRAVEEVALEHGYMLLISSSAEDAERAERLVAALSGRAVEGLIVAPAMAMDTAFLQSERDRGAPLVFVDRPVPHVDADTVLTENASGAASGTASLIAHGHRRIAFVGDGEAVFTAGQRRDGYVSALRAAGIEVDESLVVMAAPDAAGRRLDDILDRILGGDDPATAIVSGNNRWSVRLLRALRSRTESVAFIGFDDFELADVLDPGITVVAQDPATMGRLAAELLFRRIAGDRSPPEQVRLETVLIARGSGERLGPFAAG